MTTIDPRHKRPEDLTVEELRSEIVRYETVVLANYRGRWYNSGKRHLDLMRTLLEEKTDESNIP